MSKSDHKITRINPSTLYDSASMGYSQISKVSGGSLAFVSGQVAWQTSDEPVPDDLGKQTEIVVKNLQSALDALNATPQDIVKIVAYAVDLTAERQQIEVEMIVHVKG